MRLRRKQTSISSITFINHVVVYKNHDVTYIIHDVNCINHDVKYNIQLAIYSLLP